MNMKKTLCLIAILALVVVAATACSSSGDKAQSPEATPQAESGMPGDEQTAETQTYFGKVKEIVGNEVTLDLAENPIENFENETGSADAEEDGSGTVAAVAMTEAMPAGSIGDAPVEEHMEITYLGEEKNFTIPAGIEIFDLTHGQPVQLSSLQKGSVLMITVKGDTDIASGVEIWE
jgi:hypothetical protein